MTASRMMRAGTVSAPQAWGLGLFVELVNAGRQTRNDAGEDEQTHAVADAAIGDLLTQPHDEGGAGGESDDRHGDKAEARIEYVGLTAGTVREREGDWLQTGWHRERW